MKKWNFRVFPVLLFALASLCILPCHGQEIKRLETQKKDLLQEIEASNKILASTETEKKSTLNTLVSISRKINQRRNLLQTISQELDLYKDSIAFIQEEIDLLEGYLDGLENEYAKMSQQLIIHENVSGDFSFLLSSKSLEDARLRLIYLNQYQSIRKRQLTNLIVTVHDLHIKHTQFEILIRTKQLLIDEKKNQAILLEKEKESQNSLLESLKSREKEIQKELEEKNKIIDKIDDQIKLLIERTIDERNSSENIKLSESFEDNKGLFPSPVPDAIVIRPFGVQNHPSIAGLKIKNNGIDLMVEERAKIKPIFDGEIRGVMTVPGYGQVILISHGSYFSLYGNLVAKQFAKGDKVNVETILGETIVHPEYHQHILHLELWKGKQKVNPEHWISFK